MADRRMFSKTIIDSDAFLNMPLSTQSLYFHLSMRADDEGFVNNPRKVQRMIGASDDDFKVLIAKNFIIPFESGIVVIKHWHIHNYIRADRLVPTTCKAEKACLETVDDGVYELCEETKEIELLDATDVRKAAYKQSPLPYSFSYKIKRAFEGLTCPICGRTMTSAYKTTMPTVQHNIPISKGGEHELGNISVICESCNTSIRDKETPALNNAKVIELWDKIIAADRAKIKWFDEPRMLDNLDVSQLSVNCQSSDGQMSVNCQSSDGQMSAQDSIGKDRVGKDSIGESRIGEDRIGEGRGEDLTAAAVKPDALAIYASNNLTYLSPGNMNELLSFRDSLSDDMIMYAIDAACGAGKRTYDYVRSILNRIVERGFRTLGEVKAAEEERRAKQNAASVDPAVAQNLRKAQYARRPMDERASSDDDDVNAMYRELMNRPRSGGAT